MEPVRYIQIEPTTRCNFNCSYCCGRHLAFSDMSLETFKQAIDLFPSLEKVQVQGEGEPLLSPYFFDMVSYAKSKGLKVTTTSNGSLLNEENIKKLIDSGLDSIGISLDTSDQILFTELRGGSLKQICEGIRNLKKYINDTNSRNVIVGLRVTVLKRTLERLKELYQLYTDLCLDGGILLQPLMDNEYYTQYYNDNLKKQLLSDQDKLLMLKSSVSLNRKIYINREEEKEIKTIVNSKRDTICNAMRNELFIHVNGDITFCCYIKQAQENPLGNIHKDDIQTIMENRERITKKAEIGQYPEICRGCEMIDKVRKHE